jgi:tetratricopeptide (TPR) repeat protein
MRVIIAFGSLWMFCAIFSDETSATGILSTFTLGQWLQYLLGGFEVIGGVAILFPELCGLGTLVLLPTWGALLISKTLAAGNSTLETAMVVTVTIVALGNLTQLLAIFRTKNLGMGLFGKRVWWRSGLYYAIPTIGVFALVGSLFYFFQKAEWGETERQGGNAQNRGNYAEAISNFKDAIFIAQKFPKSSWRVIQSKYHLGKTYLRSNQLSLAEDTFRETIHLCQSEIDTTDPHYVLYYRSIHGLAATFKQQLRYPEAEALYLQSVASYSSSSMRPPLPLVAFTKIIKAGSHIAAWLDNQELVAVFQPFIKETIDYELAMQVEGLPATLDGLAGLYMDQRQFGKAEDYYKRALLLKTKILASEFQDLGSQLLDFRLGTDEHGKPLEGLALYEKFRPYLNHMSFDNRTALDRTLNDLGLTYWEQGRYQEAEPLFLLSLSIKQSAKSDKTPEYATTLTNLGLLYNTEGRYTEAEPKLLDALTIRERILASNDPDLAHSYNNLALLYDNLNQIQKAIPLYEKALALRQTALGLSHPKTVLTLNLLGNLYLREAHLSKAEPLFIQILQIRQQELGTAHPTVLTLMWKLANIYSEQGKYHDSLALYEQMIRLTEEQFGPNNSTTTQILSSYADVLKQAGKLKEFEKVRKRIQELSPEFSPPPNRPFQKPKHKVENSGKLT